MNYPKDLQKLIDFFKLLPGVGEKTAVRYAFSLLNMNEDALGAFSKDVVNLKQNITSCPTCGSLCEKGNCLFCNSKSRDNDVICVVEKQKDVFIFEKSGMFKGKYHVLGGLISPVEGVNPENISIDSLIKRIKKENVQELILALSPGIEGNTTALYIKKILEKEKVKITQIAQGIPIGADMEYLDDLTIELALENRSELNN